MLLGFFLGKLRVYQLWKRKRQFRTKICNNSCAFYMKLERKFGERNKPAGGSKANIYLSLYAMSVRLGVEVKLHSFFTAELQIPFSMPREQSPRYPFNRRLFRFHSRSGCFRVQKNPLGSGRNRTTISQLCSLWPSHYTH